MIFPPPREHGPPHVHVRNARGKVVIELPSPGQRASVRRIINMRTSDVGGALRIVEESADELLMRWRELHG